MTSIVPGIFPDEATAKANGWNVDKLPPYERWFRDIEGDETISNLETAFTVGALAFLTVGRSGNEYQVAVRRVGGDGWETYFGYDLGETIARAVMHGPQKPPVKEMELAPWNDPKVLAIIAQAEREGWARQDEGVQYAFDSEGITPLWPIRP